jgi:hypothetical protein
MLNQITDEELRGIGLVSRNQRRLKKLLSLEWMGQALASICWIVSVFVYGFSNGEGLQMSTGDWLQLFAASCWFISNISVIIYVDKT